MAEEKREVAERKVNPVQVLTNNLDTSLDAVRDALPQDFNKARFLQNTIAVIKANPKLTEQNPKELLRGCLQGAYLGLDFMNKEAWLIPYGSELQFQVGYKGACKFVKKYSIRKIKDIYAKVIRKGDEFDYGDEDGKQFVHWKPIPFNGDDLVGVYACIQFEDGGVLYEVMSKAEVDRIRKKSRASSSGPWVTDYEQMALKTVLKRITKNVETDFDNVEQRNAWEADNAIYEKPDAGTSEVVDAFAPKKEEENVIDSTATEIPLDIPDVPQFK